MNTHIDALPKERIIEKSRLAISKWSSTHLSRYLELLAEKFFNLADKSDNNESQTRYFQVRDEIINQQAHIEQVFSQQLSQAFKNYQNLRPTNSAINISEQPAEQEQTLSLVDNDDLEEALAIKTMTLKASSDCSAGIYALNQRLAALRGGSKMSDYDNPIAPGVFAEALQSAIKDLLLDTQSRLIVYKMFDSLFMRKLDSLYKLLNQHFEARGLLPHLNYETHKSPSDLLPEELKGLESQPSLDHQIDLFKSIQQLQQLFPIPAIPAGQAITVDQLIHSIQALQHNAAGELSHIKNPQQLQAGYPQQLRQQAEQDAKKTAEIDTHIIEIVGLLFEYMLNDEKLPDSVKTLLSYLHTPFLKVAVVDKEFFNHPQHPARQLLNNLVASGERWVEPNSKHKSEVFLQIKTVVERILNDFDNDIRLFSELAFEFNRYIRQHARRIRLTEERAMQAAKGENKLKEIRLKVDAFIRKKVGQVKLPDFVSALLFEPWSNYMAFNLLRFGSRSGQWQHAATMVDDILWFVQIIQYSTQPEKNLRFNELLESLPSALQQGFDTVGYDSSQGQQIIDKLLHLHEQQRHNLEPASNTDASATEAEIQPEVIDAHIDEVDINQSIEAETKGDDIVQQLKKTEFGTWFVFDANSDQAQHVKLAWSNTTTLHFMFVNRMGQQIAVKSGQELAQAMRAGEIKILGKEEDKPFFEKALERILKQIQHKQK
ncbi:DUF1631 domain-containing protein [Dasania sp. GY-MA-18]|uniref:DUF1631 domain-containing protein n=1 Tax=Dasania phycosphaerae TaxID=2950436 RepID=A0A9J6RH01_9GAMM|nr:MULTISPECIES: DUF1631 domain-containing protein [Dasania]MCR8921173.1 DUF1631 domain-containing protein [Dasania sp. GY-MA-18]MCZ0863601.1 DUF1631 domain-containing protein [Dasania phycosphaerae]MCZ0867329.1 DUF1631 domain-containing protein [Dasania phycosphaerae]